MMMHRIVPELKGFKMATCIMLWPGLKHNEPLVMHAQSDVKLRWDLQRLD